MNKPLSELAIIHSGMDYKKNPPGDSIPIFGTGGIIGFTSQALNSGPAVLSGRKGSINNPFFVEGKFWNVDTIFCIKPIDGIDPKWLFYNFQNTDLSQLNEATGVPSVSSKALYKLSFPWVEHKYQSKIAQILHTCDSVIEKTQVGIAKYKAIKQGMLQDLFTRGIDLETGKLRPKYDDAPDLYKESKLGWIPKEWEVKSLIELCSMKSGEGITSKSIFEMGDFPVYGGNGLRGFTGSFTHFGEFTLIGRQGALCGNITRVGGRFFASEHAVVVTPNENNNVDWLSQKLDTLNLNQYSEASAQPGLSVSKILKLSITSPIKEEQELISKRLLSMDSKIISENSYLQKLQKIKSGLMSDLLSGKKPVKV